MSEFTWNPDNPLARQKGETRKSNDALQDYWLMGSGRSLSLLESKYRESTESVPTLYVSRLKIWSTRYAWQARIDRAKEIEDEDRRERWQERREDWREDEYNVARKLLERAGQMLAFPIIEMVNEQPDGSIQIVKPAKWKPSDIARYSEVASKLARLAAEMETEKVSQEIGGKIRVENIDMTKLTNEQLRRLADGEDLADVLSIPSGSGT